MKSDGILDHRLLNFVHRRYARHGAFSLNGFRQDNRWDTGCRRNWLPEGSCWVDDNAVLPPIRPPLRYDVTFQIQILEALLYNLLEDVLLGLEIKQLRLCRGIKALEEDCAPIGPETTR